MNNKTLAFLNLLLGVGAKIAGSNLPGPVGVGITLGTDLLQVAQGALALHASLNGMTQDEVLADLHDLPPLP